MAKPVRPREDLDFSDRLINQSNEIKSPISSILSIDREAEWDPNVRPKALRILYFSQLTSAPLRLNQPILRY